MADLPDIINSFVVFDIDETLIIPYTNFNDGLWFNTYCDYYYCFILLGYLIISQTILVSTIQQKFMIKLEIL